jgi:hypothetical protein
MKTQSRHRAATTPATAITERSSGPTLPRFSCRSHAPHEAAQVLEKTRIDRFLQEQLAERRVEGQPLASRLLSILLRSIKPQPKPFERVALALEEATKKLASLERYERRALSRRKFAIRAFLKNGGQIVARSFGNDELVLAERTHFPPKNAV